MASLPSLKIANWYTVDWDMVLSPGEPIVLDKAPHSGSSDHSVQ